MKYQLIKCYPGSPELGTILEEGYTGYVPDSQSKSIGSWFVSKDHVENNPEFWKPVSEDRELTVKHVEHLITITTYRRDSGGGQHVNDSRSGIRLECKEFKFIVDCGYHRSAYLNKEICLNALQTFLNNLPQSLKDYYIDDLLQKDR